MGDTTRNKEQVKSGGGSMRYRQAGVVAAGERVPRDRYSTQDSKRPNPGRDETKEREARRFGKLEKAQIHHWPNHAPGLGSD
jgi:hypothetical protein